MTDSPQSLSNRAMGLLSRFEESGDPRDIDAAVDLAQLALGLARQTAEMGGYLSNLALALAARFELTGDMADLDRSLALAREAVLVTEPESPAASTMLLNLAAALAHRCQVSGDLADLDEAIDSGRKAVACLPENHPDYPPALHNLATCLMDRGTAALGRADLDEAVALSERAAGLVSGDDAEAAAIASGLGNALLARFEYAEDNADLDRAADVLAEVLDRVPADHPEYPGWLNNYANVQLHLFIRSGSLSAADAAIGSFIGALDRTPPGSPQRLARLENLAVGYLRRATHNGELSDFDRSVSIGEELLALIPGTHPARGSVLATLSNAFRLRCEVTGSMIDADLAVAAAEQAADSHRGDGAGRAQTATLMSCLAKALLARFDWTGSQDDAHRAVAAAERAAEMVRDLGSPLEVATRTTDLANAILARGRRIGSSADSAHAIELIRDAIAVIPPDHHSYPGRLTNLTYILIECAEVADPVADDDAEPLALLNEAVAVSSERLRLMSSADPEWWIAGAAHGNALLVRYQHARHLADLGASIDRFRQVVAAVPDGHLGLTGQLGNLGNALYLRFEATGSDADLAQAADSLRRGVRSGKAGQPDTAVCQLGLGHALAALARQGAPGVLAEAIGSFGAAASNPAARSDMRVSAARAMGRAAAQAQQWDLATEWLSYAVELLPLAAWHGLSPGDREHQLGSWPGLPLDAAACALNAERPELAVEVLEQGRSVIWGQLLQIRTDPAQLAASHPELSSRLTRVRDILDQTESAAIVTAHDPPPTKSGSANAVRQIGERRMRAASEWDILLETIRKLPGFQNFGRAVSFSQLTEAAADGTVIMLNVSRIRCDALILTGAGLRVLPLEQLSWDSVMTHGQAYLHAVQLLTGYGQDEPTREEVQSGLGAIETTLTWLWRTIAEPVLADLGFASRTGDTTWPHIWWLPTGPLSLLPIHAAGCFPARSDGAASSVLDLAVSSYTPTLGALIRARRASRRATSGRRLLIVSAPTSSADTDMPVLRGAAREAEWLADRFPGSHSRRDGIEAVVGEVVGLIPGHAIAHFASHGDQNLARPSQGGLLLEDGVLTVRHVAALDLGQAELAFLSACQTAVGGIHLLDESVTLAAAFQLAGYRHVIGTLWAVSDRRTVGVVAEVYTALSNGGAGDLDHLDVERAAFALHEAVRSLRDRHHVPALLWIPYVHIGP